MLNKNKQYIVELKPNNTCSKSICPVSGESFKPSFGMWLFLEGTLDPVSLENISEFNQETTLEILESIKKYNLFLDAGIENDIPPMKFKIIYPAILFVD